MKQQKRHSELGVMEFFILALIGRGHLGSLYELQQKAGLQPGGIRPALQRLEQLNYVSRGDSSTRRKRELTLTNDGYEFLYGTWRHCFKDFPDAESALRVVGIALLMNEPGEALAYAERQAGLHRSMAEIKRVESEQMTRLQTEPLSVYRWMRSVNDARRRGAESVTFLSVVDLLKQYQEPDVRNQR